MPKYLVHADDEYLVVPAASVFHAFGLVRALRPEVAVISDARDDTPYGNVTHIEITERQAPAPVKESAS
jgi:hypothetical protein